MLKYVKCRFSTQFRRFGTKNKNINDQLLRNHKQQEEIGLKEKEKKAQMRNNHKQSLPQCLVLHPIFSDK